MAIGNTICKNVSIMPFHIGNVIEKIRKERGLTQAELAAMAHMRPNTLGDLENRTAETRLITFEKVADALGLSPAYLYSEIDKIVKPAPLLDSEVVMSEREDLLQKLFKVLTKSQRNENVLKASIEAAYNEVLNKHH